MQLTRFTDYSLRVLLYLSVDRDRNPPVTVEELSSQFAISRNHLVKIVHNMGQLGYIVTLRGRGGGIRLARDPAEYRIGDILQELEGSSVIDCHKVRCVLTGHCSLAGVLWRTMRKFYEELNRYTLADALDPDTENAVLAIHPSLEMLQHRRTTLKEIRFTPCGAPVKAKRNRTQPVILPENIRFRTEKAEPSKTGKS